MIEAPFYIIITKSHSVYWSKENVLQKPHAVFNLSLSHEVKECISFHTYKVHFLLPYTWQYIGDDKINIGLNGSSI